VLGRERNGCEWGSQQDGSERQRKQRAHVQN
jgi:hypothetical protein